MNGRTEAATAAVIIGDLVDAIASTLERAGIPDPDTEARDMVAATVGQNRFWPRLHADCHAAPDVAQRAQKAASRRAAGMPFAYAVGRAAFRHLTLNVNESVLIPRQETEVLVDLVLQRRWNGGVVADVGTGSGAIALALATEGKFDRVLATDVAVDAIKVAKENARALRLNVEFRTGDLLAPLAGERLDVLVSNPPYIAFDEAGALPPSVRDWEPSHALFSGNNGLDATSRIVRDAPELLCTGGLLALEVDCRRALQVAELVASSGAYGEVAVCQDLMGRDRFVLATRV